MILLGELITLLSPILPIETGTFSQAPPARYLVLTPLTEAFQLYADNQPQHETQEVRLSLFDQGNYNSIKNQIILRNLFILETFNTYLEKSPHSTPL